MFQKVAKRRTDRVKKSCVRKVASLLAQPLNSSSTTSLRFLLCKEHNEGSGLPGPIRFLFVGRSNFPARSRLAGRPSSPTPALEQRKEANGQDATGDLEG